MTKSISDRAKLLIGMRTATKLTEEGETTYTRWVNLRSGRARVGAEEIEILGNVFPQYRWWLMTGEEMPEAGQVSPETENIRESFQQTGTDTN